MDGGVLVDGGCWDRVIGEDEVNPQIEPAVKGRNDGREVCGCKGGGFNGGSEGADRAGLGLKRILSNRICNSFSIVNYRL